MPRSRFNFIRECITQQGANCLWQMPLVLLIVTALSLLVLDVQCGARAIFQLIKMSQIKPPTRLWVRERTNGKRNKPKAKQRLATSSGKAQNKTALSGWVTRAKKRYAHTKNIHAWATRSDCRPQSPGGSTGGGGGKQYDMAQVNHH